MGPGGKVPVLSLSSISELNVCFLLSLQLWKVKKALKMTVTWRGVRPVFQVRPSDTAYPEQTGQAVIL